MQRIAEFDTWQAGYDNASVAVYIAGTTTLASIFSDVLGAVPAANPQTLISHSLDEVNYGKFAVPLYTAANYYLIINSTDQTGIVAAPLTTLTGADISAAVAIATGALQSRSIADYVAESFYARNFGVLGIVGSVGASAATNSATIQAAINACAAAGGGRVVVPAGTFAINQLNIPANVLLTGKSMIGTVLQSAVAAAVLTLQGDRAGLADITIDGVNLQALSIGVYSVSINETRFQNVLVKRFNYGMLYRGGRRANWRDLNIDNCTIGAQYQGDHDATNTNTGDQFRNNRWCGGKVSNCVTSGIQFNFIDLAVWHNSFENIGFEGNIGTALQLNGARHFMGKELWWSTNAVNILIEDGLNAAYNPINDGINIMFQGGSMSGGALTLQSTLQDIMFDRVEFSAVAITLTQPLNPILIKDCIEDSGVSIAGDGTKWCRLRSAYGQLPASFGITTDATVTKAWGVYLNSGEVSHVRAVVVGNARNGIDTFAAHMSQDVKLAGATLNYNLQTAAFTVGDILTGSISGAKARMTANSGTAFTLRNVTGTFQNGEIITGAAGGSATINGLLVLSNAALLGGTTQIDPIQASDGTWAAAFAVNQQELQITVKGAVAKVVEWTVAVECERTA